ASNPDHLRTLEQWLRSYRPHELFDEKGAPVPLLRECCPQGARRMGASPHANGGLLLQDLHLPDIRNYATRVIHPGGELAESTKQLGAYLRDVFKLNDHARNFRMWGPDETSS